jgi:hypothetical protein
VPEPHAGRILVAFDSAEDGRRGIGVAQ